jgi:hypothetical protein
VNISAMTSLEMCREEIAEDGPYATTSAPLRWAWSTSRSRCSTSAETSQIGVWDQSTWDDGSIWGP